MEHSFSSHIPKKSLIAVGMSGGVDSSVSAYLLKQAGYDVIGIFMKNWEDDTGACTAQSDADDVARVSDTLNIPYYSVNFTKEYQENVFSSFIEQLKAGRTPNPDILCNREIKFKLLLEHATKMGAEALATGHYAQNVPKDGEYLLKKGRDPGKDQTYFLYTLNQGILQKALFPIGHLHKKEVREIAKMAGLATAEKKDSTGICFIGKRNFREFLQNYLPFQKGLFKTLDGKVVGEHHGVAYYTIGQRKGLGIGGKGDAWFVVKKDPENNIVYIEQGEDHPALFSYTLTCSESSWISGQMPPLPFACKAKVRYRQEDQLCIIEKETAGTLLVRFIEPQRAITPEQSVVFYDDDICLGGAIIDSAGPNLLDCNKKDPLAE